MTHCGWDGASAYMSHSGSPVLGWVSGGGRGGFPKLRPGMSMRVFWQTGWRCGHCRLLFPVRQTRSSFQFKISFVNVVKPFPSQPRMNPNNINNQLPDDTWGCFQHQRKTEFTYLMVGCCYKHFVGIYCFSLSSRGCNPLPLPFTLTEYNRCYTLHFKVFHSSERLWFSPE